LSSRMMGGMSAGRALKIAGLNVSGIVLSQTG
jgi:hypothetical protein